MGLRAMGGRGLGERVCVCGGEALVTWQAHPTLRSALGACIQHCQASWGGQPQPICEGAKPTSSLSARCIKGGTQTMSFNCSSRLGQTKTCPISTSLNIWMMSMRKVKKQQPLESPCRQGAPRILCSRPKAMESEWGQAGPSPSPTPLAAPFSERFCSMHTFKCQTRKANLWTWEPELAVSIG